MIAGYVVVHCVGSNLIAAHAAARFVSTLFRNRLILQLAEMRGDTFLQGNPCVATIGMLATFGRFHTDSGWSMRQHHAGLSFVSMLSSRTRIFGESHIHIFFQKSVRFLLRWIFMRSMKTMGRRPICHFVAWSCQRQEDDDRDGRCVNTPFSFGRRNALPSMATAFTIQMFECLFVFRPNFGEESTGLLVKNGPQPTLGLGVFFVKLSLQRYQQFGIVAPFGGANFNMTGRRKRRMFHDVNEVEHTDDHAPSVHGLMRSMRRQEWGRCTAALVQVLSGLYERVMNKTECPMMMALYIEARPDAILGEIMAIGP